MAPVEVEETRRISLMIREDQHQSLAERGLNVSGLVRDLIDDFLSEHKITLGVSEDTRKLYNQIVSNTGSSDQQLEKYLREALKEMLKDRIREMEQLKKKLDKEKA